MVVVVAAVAVEQSLKRGRGRALLSIASLSWARPQWVAKLGWS